MSARASGRVDNGETAEYVSAVCTWTRGSPCAVSVYSVSATVSRDVGEVTTARLLLHYLSTCRHTHAGHVCAHEPRIRVLYVRVCVCVRAVARGWRTRVT